jgi:hypothetical protein
MRLVLVHGRSQQGKDPVQLKEQWVAALRGGLQKQGLDLPATAEVVLPFYGDRLDEFAKQFDVPLSEDITTRGGDVAAEYLEFRADMLEAFRQRAGITDDQVDTEYGDNPKPRGPQNWEWVQAILRALDKYIPGMSDGTLDLFTRDVFLYIKRTGVRTEIDRIVASALSTEPVVVVSHSLGTVVSYNVLRSDPRTLKVPLYVTLGSPLGIRSIRNELRPLKFPGPASAWYNAFDERDVVALYPLDAKNFPVRPSIENNNTVLNDTENRHGISGYLKDPAVAKRIHDALVQR